MHWIMTETIETPVGTVPVLTEHVCWFGGEIIKDISGSYNCKQHGVRWALYYDSGHTYYSNFGYSFDPDMAANLPSPA